MTEYAMLESGYRIEIAALTGPLLLRTVGGDGSPGLERHRHRRPRPPAVRGTPRHVVTNRAKRHTPADAERQT
jgi:hypothetical protein